jgi:hypothetical protein
MFGGSPPQAEMNSSKKLLLIKQLGLYGDGFVSLDIKGVVCFAASGKGQVERKAQAPEADGFENGV